MVGRIGLSCVVGIASVTVFALAQAQPGERRASADLVRQLSDPAAGTWEVLSDHGEGVDRDEELSRIFDRLAARLSEELDTLGSLASDPHAAVEDALLAVRSWIEGDTARIEERRSIDGLTLQREIVAHDLGMAVKWGYGIERSDDQMAEATNADLLNMLLDAQVRSGMVITAIDIDSIEVGLGLSVALGSEEWPIRAMDVSLSHHAGPRGPIPDPDEIEDTPKTIHFRLRVKMENGTIGLVRLGYWYDDRCELWLPVAAASSIFSGPHTCRLFAF